LLLGRSKLPTAGTEGGADVASTRAHATLTGAGIDFLYNSVDLSDANRLKECWTDAERHWDTQVDGVFHLAGTLGDADSLVEHWKNIDKHTVTSESRESFEKAFAAKIYGTM